MVSREFLPRLGIPYTGLLVVFFAVSTAALGWLAVTYPAAALVAGGAVFFVTFVAISHNRLPTAFHWSLGISLVGYALLSRGFAYAGVPPLFIGEVVLVLAALTILVRLRNARFGPLESLLCLFALWGAFRTVPYIGSDGIDAIRDGAVWIYATFAFAIAFSVQRRHFETIARWYAKLIPFFLIWILIAFAIRIMFQHLVPSWPMSGASVLAVKAGDFGVHLAGIACFMLVGALAHYTRSGGMRELLLWPIWFFGTMLVAALNRGGLLAISVAVAVSFMLRGSSRFLSLLFGAALILTTFTLVDPTVDLGRRELSTQQLTTNIKSVFSETESRRLDGTIEWRVAWWTEIVNYTVHGPYFWTGKGFGVNLAADDGFQGYSFRRNRSPHNGHMTILARMGVPGFAVWVTLQAAFGIGLIVAFVRALRRGDVFWWQLTAWLLVYWLAMIINMSFDVYLEGPQGGIWFWAIIGLGLAAMRIQAEDYRSEPEKESEHVTYCR